MEKIINKLINEFTKGVDTYSHNGSTWLIFTDTKQWVIELTESKTLWYNYNFFKGMFAYTSMDVVENQSYITKWVEDNIVGGVKHTARNNACADWEIEDTIQNDVKETIECDWNIPKYVINEVVNDGVKETIELMNELPNRVKKIIKKGVKKTKMCNSFSPHEAEDVIKNGVKHTQERIVIKKSIVDDAIEKGVKEIHDDVYHHKGRIDGVIKNGVKETKTPGNGDIVSTVEWLKENNSTSYPKMIDDVIENGIKEVQPLPDQSGELIGYGNYYHGKENRTKPFIDYLEETIKFGVRENLV